MGCNITEKQGMLLVLHYISLGEIKRTSVPFDRNNLISKGFESFPLCLIFLSMQNFQFGDVN